MITLTQAIIDAVKKKETHHWRQHRTHPRKTTAEPSTSGSNLLTLVPEIPGGCSRLGTHNESECHDPGILRPQGILHHPPLPCRSSRPEGTAKHLEQSGYGGFQQWYVTQCLSFLLVCSGFSIAEPSGNLGYRCEPAQASTNRPPCQQSQSIVRLRKILAMFILHPWKHYDGPVRQ